MGSWRVKKKGCHERMLSSEMKDCGECEDDLRKASKHKEKEKYILE